MSTSKKQLMKGKIYKIKSRLLIRKYRSFLPLWSKFTPLKNKGNTIKNIRQVRPIRHFLKSTKLRLPYMKMPFQNSKNPIPSSQIQMIFYLNLINYKKNNTLMQEYSSSKSIMNELYKIRKNYGIYMGKEIER